MFCPKCGTNVPDDVKTCPNCGLDFSTLDKGTSKEPITTDSNSKSATPEEKNKNTKSSLSVKSFVFFGLAAVVLVMAFIAANNISEGGNEIMQIQSVGGKTLEEAYYFQLGKVYSGYAMFVRMVGVSFASVLAWMGLKN